ncbi:MAG: hypothetical protein ACKOOF_09780, partial [Planctomycetaceae bacterium]
MIARLVEAHYAVHAAAPDAAAACQRLEPVRPLLAAARAGDRGQLAAAQRAEEDAGREADRRGWAPRKRERE